MPPIESWIDPNRGEKRPLSFWEKEQPESIQAQRQDERIEPLPDILKKLEDQFRKNKQLDDANKAYYHRNWLETKTVLMKEPGSFWVKLFNAAAVVKTKSQGILRNLVNLTGSFVAWFFQGAVFIWGVSSGFGTRIWLVLGWMTFFLLLFAIFYVFGDLSRSPAPEEKESEFVFKQRLFDFPRLYHGKATAPWCIRCFLRSVFQIFQRGWWFIQCGAYKLVNIFRKTPLEIPEKCRSTGIKENENSCPHRASAGEISEQSFELLWQKFKSAVRLSWVILVKIGYRDTTVSGRFLGISYGFWIFAEWLIGFYLLAALFYTLSTSLPLLNRLIRGLF